MHTINLEPATLESVAPFGTLVGVAPGANPIFRYEGIDFYQSPFRLDGTPELIVCNMPRRPFRIGMIERHFRHNQTYLPLNGKAFIIVVAPPSESDVPPLESLRAFLFQDGCGIALGEGVWHDLPLAMEDDTQIAVVLTSESHVNTDPKPEKADDADGPDLQRRSLTNRGIEIVIAVD